MADYTAMPLTLQTVAFGGSKFPPAEATVLSGGGGVTVTYYYRTSAGVRGNTTDFGSIPVGAVVERIVTT